VRAIVLRAAPHKLPLAGAVAEAARMQPDVQGPEAVAGEPPIFSPAAFRLTDAQADLIAKAHCFGARVLAPRA